MFLLKKLQVLVVVSISCPTFATGSSSNKYPINVCDNGLFFLLLLVTIYSVPKKQFAYSITR